MVVLAPVSGEQLSCGKTGGVEKGFVGKEDHGGLSFGHWTMKQGAGDSNHEVAGWSCSGN
jgi:hypothetical protein